MQLEFHQLELRYERLRIVRPEQEHRLFASLAEVGQQVPIVVVQPASSSQPVVIDGYKRIRGLRRLHRDTVEASTWPGEEVEALIITRLMQTAETETALEQSWLLLELKQRFGFSLEELARRFGHSVSWVSRRLALVQELPGRSAAAPLATAIIFLRDQPAMPGQQGLGRDNRCHLAEMLASQSLGPGANRRRWSSLKRNRLWPSCWRSTRYSAQRDLRHAQHSRGGDEAGSSLAREAIVTE